MALFSIKNERDLIVINGLASEVTAATFATGADAGEGKIYNQFGTAVTGKEKFSVYVKHLDGRVRKSDLINPDMLTQFKKVIPVSPVLPKAVVTVTAFVAADTYEINVRIWNDGSLGRDDVMFLNASYSPVTGDTTVTNVADGLVKALNAAQTRMGQTWFTITNTAGAITLQSTLLPFQTGKQDGRALEFVVKATEVNPSTLVLGSMTVAYTEFVSDPTALNFIRDLEWQTRGAFGDSYRGLMYPFDFPLQSDVVTGTVYTLYEFDFTNAEAGRSHDVQLSPRHLTVAVPAANVAAFDAAIAMVRAQIDLGTAATDGQVITWTDAAGTYHAATDTDV
jgi:hypothetical protein